MKSALLILFIFLGQVGDGSRSTRSASPIASEDEWISALTKDAITHAPEADPFYPENLRSYAFKIYEPTAKGGDRTFALTSQQYRKQPGDKLLPTFSRAVKGKILTSRVDSKTGEFELSCESDELLSASDRNPLQPDEIYKSEGKIVFTFENPNASLREAKTLWLRFDADLRYGLAWRGKRMEFVREEFFRDTKFDRTEVAKTSDAEWERIVSEKGWMAWKSDDIVAVSLGTKGKPRQLIIQTGAARRIRGKLEHDSEYFVGSWSSMEVGADAIRVQCRIDHLHTEAAGGETVQDRGFRGGDLELVFQFVKKDRQVARDRFQIYYYNSKPLADLSWWKRGDDSLLTFLKE